MRYIVIIILICISAGPACAQNYGLSWICVNSGGESNQSSANYGARLSLAQTTAGYCESTNLRAFLGFWLPMPGTVTSVEEIQSGNLPTDYSLRQNYPNPFNPETTIEFRVPKGGWVSISVYNTIGQLVTVLVNEPLGAGYYRIRWNGCDYRGDKVASGIYLYRLQAADIVMTKKMVLLK